jgi:hypothetical protein
MARQGTVELRAGPAVVRALRGSDEEWLRALDRDTPVPRATTALLSRCVPRLGGAAATPEAIRALGLFDRDRLILAVWRLSLGPRMELVLRCPACDAPMDADVEVDDSPPGSAPAAGARVRLPSGGDLEAIAGAGDPALALLERCAIDVTAPRDVLEEELERLDPGAVAELDADCPECGARFTTALDPAMALLAELGRRQPQLDRDVHLLSLHYHWPLREILGMGRLQRRAYVERLLSQLDVAAA